jgi:hypothetical protein
MEQEHGALRRGVQRAYEPSEIKSDGLRVVVRILDRFNADVFEDRVVISWGRRLAAARRKYELTTRTPGRITQVHPLLVGTPLVKLG